MGMETKAHVWIFFSRLGFHGANLFADGFRHRQINVPSASGATKRAERGDERKKRRQVPRVA